MVQNVLTVSDTPVPNNMRGGPTKRVVAGQILRQFFRLRSRLRTNDYGISDFDACCKKVR